MRSSSGEGEKSNLEKKESKSHPMKPKGKSKESEHCDTRVRVRALQGEPQSPALSSPLDPPRSSESHPVIGEKERGTHN